MNIDIKCIKDSMKDHAGEWIAVKNGILLGSDKNRVSLHNKLKQNGNLKGSIFFKVEGETP